MYQTAKKFRDLQVDSRLITPDDFSEVGTPGIRQLANTVHEAYTPELTWPNAFYIYDDMRRRTPTLRALLNAVNLLAKPTSWYFEASGDSDVDKQAAEFANSCLDDLKNPISQTVEDMLTALAFGWATSEIVFGRRVRTLARQDAWSSSYDDGLVGWQSFEFRKQASWYKWEFDPLTKKYLGMWQQDMPLPPVFLPAHKLIHFTPFRDGANPEGVSLLESAYEPYYYLKNYGIILGVGMERSVTGWPVFKYAQKPSDKDKKQIEAAAASLLAGSESGYLSLPPGADFDFKNVTNTNANSILEIMRYYNVLILQMMLADFIWMGSAASGGSYGLGQDKSVLFIMAVNGVLDSLADAINNSAVKKLFEYNTFPGLAKPPRLVHSPVRKPKSLGEIGSFISSISTVIPMSLDDQANIRSYTDGVLSPQVVEPPAPQVDPMTGLPIPTPVNPILTPGQVGEPLATDRTGAAESDDATAQLELPKISELSYLKSSADALLVDYEADLWDPVIEFIDGTKEKEEAQVEFNERVIAYLPEAFWRGYREAGGDVENPSVDASNLLLEYMRREIDFSRKFWNKLELSRSEGGLIRPTPDLWVNTLGAMYSLGKAAGAPDVLLTFVRVKTTKDACKTCISLEGKRHSAKWFSSRGYIPVPGCNLDCGGYRCGHELVTDNGDVWLSAPWAERELDLEELAIFYLLDNK